MRDWLITIKIINTFILIIKKGVFKMATRAQVYFKETGIYLYQHNNGDSLFETVQESLVRGKERANDPEYLARIVFCDMIKESSVGFDGLTGFGIGKVKHGDIDYLITVEKGKATVKEIK